MESKQDAEIQQGQQPRSEAASLDRTLHGSLLRFRLQFLHQADQRVAEGADLIQGEGRGITLAYPEGEGGGPGGVDVAQDAHASVCSLPIAFRERLPPWTIQ